MKFTLPITATVFALALSACSNADKGAPAPLPPPPVVPQAPPVISNQTPPPVSPIPSGPQILEKYEYEFVENKCTTGKHNLASKKEYCDALLNDSLNSNCGREMRVQTYQIFCTGTASASPGQLPAMSTARCIVNGMDLKDRTFLDNINPFNPQRRQSFRDMFWSGKKSSIFNVFSSLSKSYGTVHFSMNPAQSDKPATGQLYMRQLGGEDLFSAQANLGSKLRMLVSNYTTETEVEAVCISEKTFRQAKKNHNQVRCLTDVSDPANKKNHHDDVLAWDMQTAVEKDVYRGRHNEAITVRLKPAVDGEDAIIQIEGDAGFDKTMKVEGTLNEGLSMRYNSKDGRTSVSVVCEPASK